MRKGTCKHFHGALDRDCSAGADMRAIVGGPDLGWFMRTPCHKSHDTEVVCDRYTEPSDEELAEYDAETKRLLANVRKSLPAIAKIKQRHEGQDAKGGVECPVCGGTLHYTHSGHNGHVWGKCETENCLAFAE